MINETLSVFLRKPDKTDLKELVNAFEKSQHLHHPWTFIPKDFERYIAQPHRYLVCHKESNAIVGSFNIAEIVEGWFHSAYLGYEAFVPHQGQGYMYQGLMLVIEEAFSTLNLHRLEANIQPANQASIALVAKAGFVKEGFSAKYLRVGGEEWKDHERWAIINENWSEEVLEEN